MRWPLVVLILGLNSLVKCKFARAFCYKIALSHSYYLLWRITTSSIISLHLLGSMKVTRNSLSPYLDVLKNVMIFQVCEPSWTCHEFFLLPKLLCFQNPVNTAQIVHKVRGTFCLLWWSICVPSIHSVLSILVWEAQTDDLFSHCSFILATDSQMVQSMASLQCKCVTDINSSIFLLQKNKSLHLWKLQPAEYIQGCLLDKTEEQNIHNSITRVWNVPSLWSHAETAVSPSNRWLEWLHVRTWHTQPATSCKPLLHFLKIGCCYQQPGFLMSCSGVHFTLH